MLERRAAAMEADTIPFPDENPSRSAAAVEAAKEVIRVLKCSQSVPEGIELASQGVRTLVSLSIGTFKHHPSHLASGRGATCSTRRIFST